MQSLRPPKRRYRLFYSSDVILVFVCVNFFALPSIAAVFECAKIQLAVSGVVESSKLVSSYRQISSLSNCSESGKRMLSSVMRELEASIPAT